MCSENFFCGIYSSLNLISYVFMNSFFKLRLIFCSILLFKINFIKWKYMFGFVNIKDVLLIYKRS